MKVLSKETRQVNFDESTQYNTSIFPTSVNTQMQTANITSSGFFEKEKRQLIRFDKHCDEEEEKRKIFIAIFSENSGSIRIKQEFKSEEREVKIVKNDNMDIDALLGELNSWYQTNKIASVLNQANFKELNKTERLYQMYPENFALNLQQRMWQNYTRRETAFAKAQELTAQQYEIDKANIEKWEVYRD